MPKYSEEQLQELEERGILSKDTTQRIRDTQTQRARTRYTRGEGHQLKTAEELRQEEQSRVEKPQYSKAQLRERKLKRRKARRQRRLEAKQAQQSRGEMSERERQIAEAYERLRKKMHTGHVPEGYTVLTPELNEQLRQMPQEQLLRTMQTVVVPYGDVGKQHRDQAVSGYWFPGEIGDPLEGQLFNQMWNEGMKEKANREAQMELMYQQDPVARKKREQLEKTRRWEIERAKSEGAEKSKGGDTNG